jgi:large subunit ribosomal protein L12
MEYVYASLLLHEAKKEISEQSVSRVLEAAGIEVDKARVKALIASLKNVDIGEAIQKAAVMPAAVAEQQSAEPEKHKAEQKKYEEEEEKAEQSAAEGLGSLFG